jgi:hypothetical protein
MAASQALNIGLNYKWNLGESGWNQQMDENLVALDALVLISVKAAGTITPPGSPTGGDRYIVGSAATGAWAGKDGKIAQWDSSASAWNFFTPKQGWEVRADDTHQTWIYHSGSWALEGALYGQYANDSAAASGGVPVRGFYVNSSTGALQVRLS